MIFEKSNGSNGVLNITIFYAFVECEINFRKIIFRKISVSFLRTVENKEDRSMLSRRLEMIFSFGIPRVSFSFFFVSFFFYSFSNVESLPPQLYRSLKYNLRKRYFTLTVKGLISNYARVIRSQWRSGGRNAGYVSSIQVTSSSR